MEPNQDSVKTTPISKKDAVETVRLSAQDAIDTARLSAQDAIDTARLSAQDAIPTVTLKRPRRGRRRNRVTAALLVLLALLVASGGLLYTFWPQAPDVVAFWRLGQAPAATATATSAPDATEVPTATDVPLPTDTPLATDTPQPTMTPVSTATLIPPTATRPPATPAPVLHYYGADLTGMRRATGIGTDDSLAAGGAWPQVAGNYCALANIQGIVNYIDWSQSKAPRFPIGSDQGPPTNSTSPGNPGLEQPGQVLFDLDQHAVADWPPGSQIIGSASNRRPFSLANISHDFGLDPRAIAAGIMYETGNTIPYHQHIYHNGPDAAAWHIAYATARFHLPVVTIVNHGSHAVLIAGVWATADPSTNPQARIDSFAVYNPWNQNWGDFLGGVYFTRLPYRTLTTAHPIDGSWLSRPYATNGDLDPDPYMGPYQAGTDPFSGPTANPQGRFWLNNLVTIEPDGHNDQHPDNAYNEADQVMTGP